MTKKNTLQLRRRPSKFSSYNDVVSAMTEVEIAEGELIAGFYEENGEDHAVLGLGGVNGQTKAFFSDGQTGGGGETLEIEKIKEAIGYFEEGDLVDLGLPSGTLWAKCNLGAEKETDFGKFFQWGDTHGYSDVDENQFKRNDYKWDNSGNITKYNETDNKLVLDNEDDPVFVATNGKFKSPTIEQLQELTSHTDHEWIENFEESGVNGMMFINKNDDTKYIFIPAAGDYYDGNYYEVGSWGYVWSVSRDESGEGRAWYMLFHAGVVGMNTHSRCYGYSVRGVVAPADDGQTVDLGLPSGTLWAKTNLGAEKETDFGLYYQWGDTQGYSGITTDKQFVLSDYKWYDSKSNTLTKYNSEDGLTTLQDEDDPVYTATGGQYKSPTKDQLQELISHTDHEWTSIDGVNGMKFVNKNDDTKYIFIPAAGYCGDGSRHGVGSRGYVWSASRNESNADSAWYVDFNVYGVSMSTRGWRYIGYPVRGVVSKNI